MSLYVVDASDDDDFWLNASQQSIDSVWDNSEDDIYVERRHGTTPVSASTLSKTATD
jgi:hypothetical protein